MTDDEENEYGDGKDDDDDVMVVATSMFSGCDRNDYDADEQILG